MLGEKRSTSRRMRTREKRRRAVKRPGVMKRPRVVKRWRATRARRKEKYTRHRLSRALITLREQLGETQQKFADRVGLTVTTIARYETQRPPRGQMLARLEQVARSEGHAECANTFLSALEKELGSGALSLTAKQRRNPWRLYGRDQLTQVYDEFVGEINRQGDTVVGIRMEFDGGKGQTILADIAIPETQPVTKKGKTTSVKVSDKRDRNSRSRALERREGMNDGMHV
jgi:transcriptional regulator with XRE-family HTH domain